MDEFYKNLSSPAWWIGVVIVGLILSIIGNLLTPVFKDLGLWFVGKLAEFSRSQRRKLNSKLGALGRQIDSLFDRMEKASEKHRFLMVYDLRYFIKRILTGLLTILFFFAVFSGGFAVYILCLMDTVFVEMLPLKPVEEWAPIFGGISFFCFWMTLLAIGVTVIDLHTAGGKRSEEQEILLSQFEKEFPALLAEKRKRRGLELTKNIPETDIPSSNE